MENVTAETRQSFIVIKYQLNPAMESVGRQIEYHWYSIKSEGFEVHTKDNEKAQRLEIHVCRHRVFTSELIKLSSRIDRTVKTTLYV